MMTERTLSTMIVLLLALPLAPISRAWYVARKAGGGSRGGLQRDGVLLTVVTASYLVILGGLLFRGMLGVDYSARRFTTICLNLGLMVVVTAWTAARRGPLGGILPLSAAVVAAVWLYIAAISSVV